MKIAALVIQTFRELKSKATLGVLASISTLVIVAVLIGLSTNQSSAGVSILLFGNPVSPELPPEQMKEIVVQVQAALANGLFAGLVIFGIFATAGLIPDMLEKGTAELFLSKPIPRWQLLLGKYSGAAAVVLANVLYFIGSLSVIFGMKTGVWNVNFVLASFTLTFAFGCLYAGVVALGVISRNTAISIIGAFLYLFLISGLLHQREHIL